MKLVTGMQLPQTHSIAPHGVGVTEHGILAVYDCPQCGLAGVELRDIALAAQLSVGLSAMGINKWRPDPWRLAMDQAELVIAELPLAR
jgi:hypothetical protein